MLKYLKDHPPVVEGLRADVKRLEGECEAWEDTVDAMLEAMPKERRGVGQHGATEEIVAAVRSYEAEIKELKEEVRRLQDPAETRITCISWKDHAQRVAESMESVSVDAIA